VKVFPVVVRYFDWKNGGLKSKSTEVPKQSKGAAPTVAKYIKGALENNIFFNLKKIWVFDCYFSKLF